jgi:hypothetical protein
VYDYVAGDSQKMLEGPNKYYGPAFEMWLLLFEKAFGLREGRGIYFMRHLVTYLAFVGGTFVFFLLAKRMFRSWKLGLLGAAMLALSPRIFADAFYNSKDIPFLAFFIVSIYTLVRYLDAGTFRWALAHAAACAVATDIRVIGLLVPGFTAAFVVAGLVRPEAGSPTTKRRLLSLAVFAAATGALVVLLWPTLWRQPVHQLAEAFKEMGHFPYGMPVLYLGRYADPVHLPWHYTAVWIAISTPIAYLACFAVGCVVSVKVIVGRAASGPIGRRDLSILLVWFFFPLVYLMVSGAAVFDGWRHTFFVYPALIGIGLVGIGAAFRAVRTRSRASASSLAALALAAALAAGLANTARIMVRNHPYQNLYFNALTGGVRGAETNFDLDYWGLAYKQALEYVVGHDRDKVIKVCSHSRPGRTNAEMLAPADRERLVFVKNPYEAKYYLTGMRWNSVEYRPEEILHRVEVEGVPIAVVVKVLAQDPRVFPTSESSGP